MCMLLTPILARMWQVCILRSHGECVEVVVAPSCASGGTVLTVVGVLQCEYPTRDGEVLAIRGIACVNSVC